VYLTRTFPLASLVGALPFYVTRIDVTNVRTNVEAELHHIVLHRTHEAYFADKRNTSVPIVLQSTIVVHSHVLYTWAMGALSFVVDNSKFALVLEPSAASPYLVVEVHYNNPRRVLLDVEARLTLHGRVPVDANDKPSALSLLYVSASQNSLLLPPGLATVQANGSCWPGMYVPPGSKHPIRYQIYAVGQHAHGWSRRISTQLNSRTVLCQTFDAHHHGWVYMDDAKLVFTEEDALGVSCLYDTSAQTEAITGGFGAREEMCTAAIYAYPLDPKRRFDFTDYCLFEAETITRDAALPLCEAGLMANGHAAHAGGATLGSELWVAAAALAGLVVVVVVARLLTRQHAYSAVPADRG